MEDASPPRGQRAIEAVLHRIALRFAGTTLADATIREALRDLGALCGADRAYVFQFDPDGEHVTNTHEWCAAGVEPRISDFQHIPVKDSPWAHSQLTLGREIVIEDVDAMPEVSKSERENIQKFSVRSFVAIPLHVRGAFQGTVGFSRVRSAGKWKKEDVAVLCLFAQILGTVLARKQTEETLMESQTRYANLFRDSSDAIVIHDLDGAIVDVNRRALALFGYSREQFLKLNVMELSAAAVLPRAREMLLTVTGQGSGTIETILVKQDGEEFAAEVSAGKFPSLNGWLIQGIIRDISVRKRAEAERNELESRLRQSQKMEAIGELAGGVAHDFNNILQAVEGNMDLLVSDPNCTQSQHAIIDEIRLATDRAAQLTRQLLAFAKRGQFQTVPVDVHSLVNEVRRLLIRGIDRRIQIITSFHALRRSVLGDPSQLQTALLNLGLNARDAMPGGGILTFATRNTRDPGDDEERIEISVADTGVGMTPEVMSRIFEPFFTTKKNGEGTGLGLASVYGCVTGMNGTIRVQSEPNKGSAFTIVLPVYAGPAKAADPVSVEAPVAGTGHIMVVDDEEIVRNATARVLSHLGYRVTVCSDGEEALRVYREKPEEIDLVILDLVMPRLSGEDTYIRMKEIDPGVRVLVSSGYSRDETINRMIRKGVMGFINKPFRVAELSRELQRLVQIRDRGK